MKCVINNRNARWENRLIYHLDSLFGNRIFFMYESNKKCGLLVKGALFCENKRTEKTCDGKLYCYIFVYFGCNINSAINDWKNVRSLTFQYGILSFLYHSVHFYINKASVHFSINKVIVYL